MKRRAVLILLASVFTLIAGRASAQQAVIYGAVTDASKGVLPGVTVTVTNQDTGLTQVAVTDERGEYRVRSLPLGTYSVTAVLSGFSPVTTKDLAIGLDAQVRVDLTLELGAVQESVVVVGEPPLVDVRRSEVGGNVTSEQIKRLPVKGRQWIDLAMLMPGTGQDAIRAQFYNSVNIGAGINFYSNGFYVDGVNNNWQQQGEPRQDFPQDAIAEFRVHAFNARSMYGFAQGGTLSVVTKSGTNEFHGGLFEFYRDKALNWRTRFETETPHYHRHQVGGSLGGPVARDRAHFFGAAEYTNEAQFYTVSTRGVFPDEEGTFKRPYYNYMILGRYDHTLSRQHRFFVRVARQNNLREGIGAGGTRARDTGFDFSAPRISVVAGETWTIGGNTLNDFRFQYAKATFRGWPSVPGLRWTKTGEFPQERVDSIPDIINRPSLSKGNNSSFLGPESRWQAKNDFSHLVGRHEITVGSDLNWVLWTPDNLGVARTWSFATDAPFDPNNPATFPFLFSQRLAPTLDHLPSTEHSAYVDDTWSLTSELTLNLGLRYDIQTGVWHEDLLERDVPEIRLADRVVRAGGKLDPTLFPFFDGSTRGDKNNFGPRLGFSWNVGGDSQRVVRGAYGVYYNRYRANSPRFELNPLARQVIIRNPSYPDPYRGRDPFELALVLPNFTIQGNRNRNHYTQQYSLGYNQQIGAHLGVSIDGTIANGYSQHTTIDHNYYLTPTDRALNQRPFPQYGQVQELMTDGRLRYRGLEVRVDRRMANRWQLLGSYTLAWASVDRSKPTFNRQTKPTISAGGRDW